MVERFFNMNRIKALKYINDIAKHGLYVSYFNGSFCLDDDFTIEHLEALVYCAKNNIDIKKKIREYHDRDKVEVERDEKNEV